MFPRLRFAALRSTGSRDFTRALMPLRASCVLVSLACAPALAIAQDSGGGTAGASSSMFSNLANPAIGMNGLFRFQAVPTLNEPYNPRFEEADLSLISTVDPYWTFNANVVFTGTGEVDPEEIWARSTNLPSVQLKLGKLRGTFGKHALLHVHAFPFVEAPIVVVNSLGDEGFKAAGVEASWLTPLPWFAELTAGGYQALDPSDENPLDFGSTRHDNVPWLGHFKNLFDLNDATTLEAGASYLQGRGSDDFVHSVYGADLTFRNVPARNSNRHGWILQSEYLERGARPDGVYTKDARGGYASFQYRLSQVWWAGIRGERALGSVADFTVDAAGDPVAGKLTRGSVNLAWTPSEFSFIRLEYSHAEADAGIHPTDDRLMVQLSYTIGYHPAHAY